MATGPVRIAASREHRVHDRSHDGEFQLPGCGARWGACRHRVGCIGERAIRCPCHSRTGGGGITVELALRYLGLGTPEQVDVDEQGRMLPDALKSALEASDGPVIVCLQAGNLHSGAFDPFAQLTDIAHRADAWVHVDGAFGLWVAASPTLASIAGGLDAADSWATDAHKTLNTPYDCGVAIVTDAARMRSSLGVHASYLLTASTVEPYEVVPEMSRRARGVPVWAALTSLGRQGVVDLINGLAAAAQGIANGLEQIPGVRVLNDVVYTQVCIACASDELTGAVYASILTEGQIMPSASVWRGQAVIRFSVSSWRTGADEVRATVEAVARAVDANV